MTITRMPLNIGDRDVSSIAYTVTGMLALWLTVASFVSWYRLRHIPGPWYTGLTSAWVGWVAYSGKAHTVYLGMSEKYGSLARIGPSALTTSDPELVKRMSNTKSMYGKSEWVDGHRLNPYHGTMFMVRDPIQHDKMKARLAPAYSGRDTPHLEQCVDQQVLNLHALIRRTYLSVPEDGVFRTMPLIDVISFFTLDVISKVALGSEFGCCAKNSDPYKFHEVLEEHVPKMGLTTDVPWIRRILYSSVGLRLFGPRETDKSGMGPLMKVTNDVVRSRRECESEALFMFVAGSDTSASAIRIALLYILSCPRVYQRLKAEIREAVREGRASSPVITVAEAKQLPYLQAVLYEGLRMRPVTTGQQAKEVPAGGDTIDGRFVPGGTSIAINFAAILRSTSLFGPDADVFRPERFLELPSQAALVAMRRNVELAFGYGRFMCAGKPLAFMEFHKIYFQLLREFDFQLMEPQHPLRSESYALFRDSGLMVRVTKAVDME
ncbi:pisatin demethylase [Apiospora rasikravindrae]|uniref:Pisatin demethylase n=1 Tax=Apiospora rasikravindrae TaxID=990691 RepID=A0ABR1S299_9PEZI